MHQYEIMLANGDRIYYKTEMSFEDFKQFILDNEYITIERDPWTKIHNGWASRPRNASYLTKSIVYVNWDEEWEKIQKDENIHLETVLKPLRENINKHVFNSRMKWWFFWHCRFWYDKSTCKELGFNQEFLEEILSKCKRYKCETK